MREPAILSRLADLWQAERFLSLSPAEAAYKLYRDEHSRAPHHGDLRARTDAYDTACALSSALNRLSTDWRTRERGWTPSTNGRSAHRNGLTVTFDAKAGSDPAAAGLVFPAYRPKAAPGFALFHAPCGPARQGAVSRLYAALKPDTSAVAAELAFHTLEDAGVEASFKVANDARTLGRADSLVVRIGDGAKVSGLLMSLTALLQPLVNGAVSPPLFSTAVADGIGIAEESVNPPPGLSYGRMMCAGLAPALVTPPGERADLIADLKTRLARMGRNPDNPSERLSPPAA